MGPAEELAGRLPGEPSIIYPLDIAVVFIGIAGRSSSPASPERSENRRLLATLAFGIFYMVIKSADHWSGSPTSSHQPRNSGDLHLCCTAFPSSDCGVPLPLQGPQFVTPGRRTARSSTRSWARRSSHRHRPEERPLRLFLVVLSSSGSLRPTVHPHAPFMRFIDPNAPMELTPWPTR
jgi:hypothetical protein